MGKHEEDATISNPSLYPQELQLKLYQAFIFSIPILFSIILFLLFYLFYLKRRAAHTLSESQIPRIQISSVTHHSTSPTWNHGIKGEIKDKLKVVYFDEQLKARDSICCVCLGEYEMREELRQLPSCKHVFHWDCIRHWLRTNATCPLCRSPVINVGRQIRHMPNIAHNSAQHVIANNSNVHNSSTTSDDDLVIHVLG